MSSQAIPPLPAGYKLVDDSGTPPLPAGYKLIDNPPAQANQQPGAISRFTNSAISTLPGAGAQPSDLIQGPKEAITHPIESAKLLWDAANSAQADTQKRALEQLRQPGMWNKVEGAVRGAYGLIPIVGPMLEHAGDQFKSGDVAGGLGTTAGLGAQMVAASPEARANMVAPVNALREFGGNTAAKLYQSSLKPSVASYSADQVKSMVKTGLDNSIPVSAKGSETLTTLIDDLNKKIKAQIQTGAQSGATVNKYKIASRLGDTVNKFSNQVNPEADLAAIGDSGNEFLRNQPNNIPVDNAQALKQGTYQQIKSKNYGELRSATMEAQKALARGIKEELQQQFPEIQDMNAREAKFIGLDEALDRAVRRIDNHQLIGIGTPIVAGMTGAATGSGPLGAIAGILKGVIDDPMVKSKLAIALNRGALTKPKLLTPVPMPKAYSRIAAYSSALAAGDSTNQGTH